MTSCIIACGAACRKQWNNLRRPTFVSSSNIWRYKVILLDSFSVEVATLLFIPYVRAFKYLRRGES